MLAVFSDGEEVFVCAVVDGEPDTGEYFEGGKVCDGRKKEDFDFALVEGPVRIERGGLQVEPERVLSGAV